MTLASYFANEEANRCRHFSAEPLSFHELLESDSAPKLLTQHLAPPQLGSLFQSSRQFHPLCVMIFSPATSPEQYHPQAAVAPGCSVDLNSLF